MATLHSPPTAILPDFLAMTLPEEAAPLRGVPAESAPALGLLTQAIRQGDENAFAQFFDCYGWRIYRHLLVLARGDEQAAREVQQAVALKLARKIEIFDEEARLWAWLRQVARNAFVDHCRARQREGRWVELHEFALTAPEPDESCLSAALHRSLDEFAPVDCELLQAAYVDGRPLQELASDASTTYKALESRLARLRQKLRARMLHYLRHDD
jgi:RNA polymerase sigma-70 factor (ECF subfamily)